MTSKDLQEALHQRPFNPFTLHIDEMTAYYVPSPDFVAHKPGSRLAVVLRVKDTGFDWVALSHVSKVSFPDEPLEAELPGVEVHAERD